ncbi:MAG: DUF3450 family protein [Deltaproteobacteria bacterium]|nr:DUF3450 family protein [Deltaproteobacteria bacterium]
MRPTSALLLGLVLLALPAASVAGEGDLRAQAEQLATLRGEVEALADELALTKDTLRSDLRAMQSESTDLEARIRREEQRLEGLKLETERLQSETRAAEDASSVLVPVLHTAMAELDARIAAGLPFRVEERREEVKTLEQQLDDALLPPSTVASRLWQLLEDELQLTRENGLYQQIVPLGDTEVLAEVARVGMVSLYYRTDTGEVGQATRTRAGWRFAELTDPVQQQVTTDLFVSLRKQIRTGWFELAQPFPEDS